MTHPLFDEAYSFANNSEAAVSGLTPLAHYRLYWNCATRMLCLY